MRGVPVWRGRDGGEGCGVGVYYRGVLGVKVVCVVHVCVSVVYGSFNIIRANRIVTRWTDARSLPSIFQEFLNDYGMMWVGSGGEQGRRGEEEERTSREQGLWIRLSSKFCRESIACKLCTCQLLPVLSVLPSLSFFFGLQCRGPPLVGSLLLALPLV